MRGALAALFLLSAASPVLAADGATLNILGFSPDSHYFAYEQYGIRDASGFPFWDVFVIDLEKDTWAKGAPIHVVVEDETSTLAAARARVKAQAADLLADYNIVEPADILAETPATEVVPDRTRMLFDRTYTSGGAPADSLNFPDIRYELKVDPVAVPMPGTCDSQDGPYPGFSLSLRDMKTKEWHALYTDETLPASRGCAVSYDLVAVAARHGVPDTDRLVAIVGAYVRGFEGSDHRFLAVPFTLPK